MNEQKITEVLKGVDTTGMSRRQILSLAAMAAAAVPLTAACSGGDRTRQTDPAATGAAVDPDRPENATWPYDEAEKLFNSLKWPSTNVPEPKSKVTVTMAITSSADAEVRHDQFAKFFQRLHPNIEIKREVTPFADFLTKYMTQAAGGNLPDLMYTHYSWAQNLIKNNVLAPIDDFIAATPDFNKDDFTATARSYWVRDGKLYGIPTDSAPKMLYYNKDIFAKAGIAVPDKSWTWEKVQQVAIELTQGEGVKKIFGFTPMPGDPFSDITPIYLLPYGGRFLSADETTCLIHEPAAYDALKSWVELQVKHGAVPSIAERQALENIDPYRTNHAAMSVNGLWILNNMLNLPEKDKFDWGVTHMPSGPQGRSTPIVGSAFALTSKAKQSEAAWILLNSFLSSAGHRFFLQMPPARLSTFEANLDAIGTNKQVITDGKDAIQEYGTSDGVLKGPSTKKIMDTALPIWERVRLGRLPLADGLKQITERVTPVLKENA